MPRLLLPILLGASFTSACSQRRGLNDDGGADAAVPGSGGSPSRDAADDSGANTGAGGSPGSGGAVVGGPGGGSVGGGSGSGSGGRGTGGSAAGTGGAGGGSSAVGPFRVTLTVDGMGTVDSYPAGIACPGICTAVFKTAAVTLEARTTNGSNQRFAGWTGGSCTGGVPRSCPLTLSADTSVKAAFAPITDNLAFVTAQTFATNLGSPSAYDALCNTAATVAGINNTAGDAFAAFLSSSTSAAAERLGNARGWVRLDGRPIMDTLASSLGERKVFNPILYDDTGTAITKSVVAMTGTKVDGSLDPTFSCSDWTGNGNVGGADADRGPSGWNRSGSTSCSLPCPLICLGKTHTTTVVPVVVSGRRIWITDEGSPLGAGQTPDQACQANRPAGVTAAAAFIATTTRPASNVLVPDTSYVRLDGTLVGTGAQIEAGTLESGIWQHASGAYLQTTVYAFTGSTAPGTAGTAASTCSDWTDSTVPSFKLFGEVNTLRRFWQGINGLTCQDKAIRFYCVQTTTP